MAPAAIYRDLPSVSNNVKQPSVPEVQSFDAQTVTTNEVVNALILAGGCIIRNLVSKDDLAQIEKDTRPYINADKPWSMDDFFPPETRRVTGLFNKSRTFIEAIPANKLYQSIADVLLTDTIYDYCGQRLETFVSKPQLNNTIVFSIGHGAKAQELHRDDAMHHNRIPAITADQYEVGKRDTGLGCFVAGKKTTRANGATRFIPGSHLWDRDVPGNEGLTFYAELEPGDAFFMLSSAIHGGSANTTTDEERLVYSCFMTKGFLRQEENQYLTTPIELMKTYPVEIQKLAGYQASIPYLGWVNMEDPLNVLADGAVDGKLGR